VGVERNPKAISDKQPAFVIREKQGDRARRPLGHLFIGTILTSPVLYFGTLQHCGNDQWLSLFFNRGLRVGSDHHLAIMRSTSSQGTPVAGEPGK
jgi:hypothetical protein